MVIEKIDFLLSYSIAAFITLFTAMQASFVRNYRAHILHAALLNIARVSISILMCERELLFTQQAKYHFFCTCLWGHV
jgi:hypothetical protein